MTEYPFLFFGQLPDPPAASSDGHGYAVRFHKKPAKTARKAIVSALLARNALRGDDSEVPWRWSGAWLVAWFDEPQCSPDAVEHSRYMWLEQMGTVFVAAHAVAPIAEVIYLTSSGKGTSVWDRWSWTQQAPSSDGLALLDGGGEVDRSVEKHRVEGLAGPQASSTSSALAVVALDPKHAPKPPKLVPVLKAHMEVLEKARDYGKERVVRVLDTPRGQVVWHRERAHRITVADAAGGAIVGAVDTRYLDANAFERGALSLSADAKRLLFTDRLCVHELDLESVTSRLLWREERDEIEPGPREAAYVGEGIVVSTLDALWLLDRQPDGEFAPVSILPLEGFSHLTATPDGLGAVVCTFDCESEPPAVRVVRVHDRALFVAATLTERVSDPTLIDGRLLARVAKKPVEIVGLSAGAGTPPTPTSVDGSIRLELASIWPSPPRLASGRRVISATPLPTGWLAALEAASGYDVVALDSHGDVVRNYDLPAGYYSNLAVSPSGVRALVSTRRRIDRFENPRSCLLDLSTGSHEVFGGTTVHAFVSEDVVLAGGALMDVASRAIKDSVPLPGHQTKARSIAINQPRTHALIQTSHGDGLLLAISCDSLRAIGVTPLRPAAIASTTEGDLMVLADGRYYRVDVAD